MSGVHDRHAEEAQDLLTEWFAHHDDPDEDPPVDELFSWADRAAALLKEMFDKE